MDRLASPYHAGKDTLGLTANLLLLTVSEVHLYHRIWSGPDRLTARSRTLGRAGGDANTSGRAKAPITALARRPGYRAVPLTTHATLRAPHLEQRSRLRRSGPANPPELCRAWGILGVHRKFGGQLSGGVARTALAASLRRTLPAASIAGPGR